MMKVSRDVATGNDSFGNFGPALKFSTLEFLRLDNIALIHCSSGTENTWLTKVLREICVVADSWCNGFSISTGILKVMELFLAFDVVFKYVSGSNTDLLLPPIN